MNRYLNFFIIGLILMAEPLFANDSLPEDLTELSLEALMSIEVTSVSRRAEKIADAAAAVFVITQEDIQRSGATSIPDLLRMVPGLHVAKIDASKWAVTSRGFNGRFANKLLVLMDGRSIYSPLFSGVIWEIQDTVIEDIERIEIIRGPGATLWGANAVNGVINIITKTAEDTQGALISGGSGTEKKIFGTVRYGGTVSDQTHYRLYAKYMDHDSNVDADGKACADQWHQWRSGFRLDHQVEEKDNLTLQGDIYQGLSGETATYPVRDDQFPYFAAVTEDGDNENFGGNILGRWSRDISETSDLILQVYYDHALYTVTTIDSVVDTFDIDFQHSFQPFKKQLVIWGLGYRFIHDALEGTYSTSLDPESQDYDIVSAFIQDDITIVPQRWRLTIGTKFEHNDYSGVEWQPSARLLWTPDDHQSLWAAVSRAVRTPSRGDVANVVKMIVPETDPLLLETVGNPDQDSEEVVTYELGYRIQPTTGISFDFATFYNDYDKLRLSEFNEIQLNPPPEPSFLNFDVSNNLEGNSYGIEAAVDWRPLQWWRLQCAYTYLEMELKVKVDTPTAFIQADEKSSPGHQASLRSFLDLSDAWQLDLWLRYVDELSAIDIDSYIEMDARLGWRIRPNTRIELVGQNLLDSHHPEYVSQYLDTKSTEVQRCVYGRVTLEF